MDVNKHKVKGPSLLTSLSTTPVIQILQPLLLWLSTRYNTRQ